jgi:uncharacterized protein YqfB (UPF0267 family)
MVAYSFKRQFEAPILAGTKQQTIRADRKRHARPGEELQLYTGQRTKACRLIGRATCESTTPITLDFHLDRVCFDGTVLRSLPNLDEFAKFDGFDEWRSLKDFWRREHETVCVWSGVLIRWGALILPTVIEETPNA